MNKKQKRICGIVIGVIILMFLFPPFTARSGSKTRNAGYHFILDVSPSHHVNTSLLLTQWVGVLIIGGIAYFMAKGVTQEKKET